MKFTIRTKVLIGFTLLLLLSSVIQAFTFNLTKQYITSQIKDLQTDQAEKGASEVQRFFAGLSLDSFGLAYLLGRGELSTVNLTKENISPVTNYIIKNKD